MEFVIVLHLSFLGIRLPLSMFITFTDDLEYLTIYLLLMGLLLHATIILITLSSLSDEFTIMSMSNTSVVCSFERLLTILANSHVAVHFISYLFVLSLGGYVVYFINH